MKVTIPPVISEDTVFTCKIDREPPMHRAEIRLANCIFFVSPAARKRYFESGQLGTQVHGAAWIIGDELEEEIDTPVKIAYDLHESDTFMRENDGGAVFNADVVLVNNTGIWAANPT